MRGVLIVALLLQSSFQMPAETTGTCNGYLLEALLAAADRTVGSSHLPLLAKFNRSGDFRPPRVVVSWRKVRERSLTLLICSVHSRVHSKGLNVPNSSPRAQSDVPLGRPHFR